MSHVSMGNLPSFNKPPVTEVALSVQFDKIAKMRSFQLAALWERFSDGFPKVEEHPPLDPIVEQLKMGPQSRRIELTVMQLPEVSRYFFVSGSGKELIQAQPDRFGHNWRKTGEGDEYPRYEKIREQFRDNLNVFCGFLAEKKLGPFLPRQVDITYVNHIVAGNGWEDFGDIQRVVNVQSLQYSDQFLQPPESISHSERHLIRLEDESAVGRLHIIMEPAFRISDKKPILNLQLIARGFPITEDIEGVMSFLDLGRESIVKAFASFTTQEMHEIWGRTQ